MWAWARLLGAALVLAVLVSRLGAGPFLTGVRDLGPGTLLAAVAITAGTTVCSAWRWRVVAGAIGVDLPLRSATAAYYRSQFLNCVLPGGVLGDVHRGVVSGAEAGDVGRGVRAVVWERTAGQVVQVVVALAVLLTLPSPVHDAAPVVVAVGVAVVIGGFVAVRALVRHGPARMTRRLWAVGAEARSALLHPRTWPPVTVASLLVVLGHTGTLLLAVAATGAAPAPARLVPLALLVLLAASVPLNVGGWGPREGVAAWAFAAAGLGADRGVAVATAFGVMTVLSALPGSVVLLLGWIRPRRARARARRARTAPPERRTADVPAGGGAHG
jgi:uncharacterized membrane protein YbhN (UPF0104 family)